MKTRGRKERSNIAIDDYHYPLRFEEKNKANMRTYVHDTLGMLRGQEGRIVHAEKVVSLYILRIVLLDIEF